MRHASNQSLVFAGRSMTALLLAFALSVVVSRPAFAQDYPDRAVKIVVPFAAGGTADAVPRFVGDWLSRKWGQPVVIENRTGAAGKLRGGVSLNPRPRGHH